jgi:hypothetical protein
VVPAYILAAVTEDLNIRSTAAKMLAALSRWRDCKCLKMAATNNLRPWSSFDASVLAWILAFLFRMSPLCNICSCFCCWDKRLRARGGDGRV